MNICKDTVSVITRKITCANICYAPNVQLFSIDYDYDIETQALLGDETYNSEDYMHGWELKNNGRVIVSTGFGLFTDVIPLFSNGSTYGNIYLGQNNNDICDVIKQLGYFVGNNIFEVIYNVKRLSDGIIMKKTKYNFSK
jgi:hypothetical protein